MCHRCASIGVYKGLGWCFSQYANLHKNSDTMHHFLQFFLFCGKNIWFSLCGFPPRYIGWAAATYLGNTLFMGTKKDKRYACLLYCISTTLSLKFLFMFSSPFQGSLKFFFTYEQWIYMYISIFFISLFVSFVWRCAGCCRSLLQKVWGRTLLIACYRSLSPTYPLQPLLQIGWSSSSCSSF